MKKILVTGGTVFVSRYVAEYYVQRGEDVYVLNRNSRVQSDGVTLIQADRRNLGDALKRYDFDVVIDVTAYNAEDVHCLLDGLNGFEDYIFISSSSVYPETSPQPFTEDTPIGENRIWGLYGLGKVEAELALRKRVPHAYIVRPPYLYGPMNNVYREAFVFDCAMHERTFYLPKDGKLRLQFLHVKDLCRFMDILMEQHPLQTVFNVGNEEPVAVKDWVALCYQVVGKSAEFAYVHRDIDQRCYFSFYDYDYYLDVRRQKELMPHTEPLANGLREAYMWYLDHADLVNKKPLMEFIDKYFR